jgi:acyl carrier protein
VTKAPSRTEILDVVSTVLDRDLGVQSSSPIDEHTRFFADLGLASIDAVVLGERLQEHYGHPLPFNELMAEIGRRTGRDLSIGELVAFLAANLPGANNS